MLYKYSDMLARYGSTYQVSKMVEAKGLTKIVPGLYTDKPYPNPNAIICALYPQAILTMDSAFYLHGLTDVIPDLVHVATPRNSTRIRETPVSIRQYFMEKKLMQSGIDEFLIEQTPVRVFSREHMLVELLRSSARLAPDYYKELVRSYRKIAPELDMSEVENTLYLYKRSDSLFDKLQKEVL